MLEIGDKVELVFSTMYVGGLCPGLKGVVTGLDGTDITSVLWDTGVEQKLIPPGVDTYRVISRSFATEAHGAGRLVMQPVGDNALPPPPPPQPGDEVEFLFSAAYLGGGLRWGSRGEVLFVDDLGTIHVKWDNGAALGLIPDWDHFRVLPKKLEGTPMPLKPGDRVTLRSNKAHIGNLQPGDKGRVERVNTDKGVVDMLWANGFRTVHVSWYSAREKRLFLSTDLLLDVPCVDDGGLPAHPGFCPQPKGE